ncbi:MAG: hypothetical protein WCS15_06085 [Prevotella sp.]
MKIKNGKLKLSKNDRRVGNFVFTEEDNFIKIQDINGIVSHRISRKIVKGQFLEALLKESAEGTKLNYCTVMFNILGVIPDMQFYDEVIKSCNSCVERHKEMYGVKSDIDKAEDDSILKEEKELNDFTDEIKSKIPIDENKEAKSGD